MNEEECRVENEESDVKTDNVDAKCTEEEAETDIGDGKEVETEEVPRSEDEIGNSENEMDIDSCVVKSCVKSQYFDSIETLMEEIEADSRGDSVVATRDGDEIVNDKYKVNRNAAMVKSSDTSDSNARRKNEMEVILDPRIDISKDSSADEIMSKHEMSEKVRCAMHQVCEMDDVPKVPNEDKIDET